MRELNEKKEERKEGGKEGRKKENREFTETIYAIFRTFYLVCLLNGD